MALTGLFLVGFLVGHLIGNLQLFLDNPEPFNRYAHMLISMGPLLIVIELVLIAIFLVHMVSAISVTWANWKSRPNRYHTYKSAGATSKKTFSSSTMIWTGVVLLVFLVVHIYTLKYGPGMAEGYTTTIDGEEVRDLYRLVIDEFQKPWYTLFYVVCMFLLGFHLRHGFWSAFQSLGVHHPKWTPHVYTLGLLVAVILGVGFIGIAVWIFLQGGS
jgi:succinate dehydrogenase / fumarate reductase cytochrome b subunit